MTRSREADRRRHQLLRRVGEDFRRGRLDAGMSAVKLANAAGVDDGYLNRIERGSARPSVDVLAAIATALGGDLGLRFYPGTGPHIHDRIQAAMVEAVLRVLHPRWRRFTEVAVHRPVRGVIDLVLHDESAGLVVASEAQSEIRRLEQQVRWSQEKAESLPSAEVARFMDSPTISRLLILRSTRVTRRLAREYRATFATAFPAPAADIHAALTTDAPWPGAGILWATVEGSDVRILARPPRGVAVGR